MRQIALFLLLFASPLLRAQQQYFVSPTGTDAPGLGSLVQPFQTVQYAILMSSPGTTVYVMTGVYHEHLNFMTSGTASQPIVLTNYSGENAIIDGNGQAQPLLQINGKSNLHISGLEFRNVVGLQARAIEISGAASNIEIKNCYFHSIYFDSNPNAPVDSTSYAWVVRVKGDDVTAASSVRVLHNRIENCRLGWGAGIFFTGHISGFSISHNSISFASGYSSMIFCCGFKGTCPVDSLDKPTEGLIQWNQLTQALPANEYPANAGISCNGVSDCRIENNRINGCYVGIGLWCQKTGKKAERNFIRDNIIYGNTQGIGCGVSNGNCGIVDGVVISNNTLYMNNYGTSGGEEIYIAYSANVKVENNIIYGEGPDLISIDNCMQSVAIDYNFYNAYTTPGFYLNTTMSASFSAWQNASGFDAHSFYADPQFMSTSDLHLQANSPAIDAGDTDYIAASGEVDMDTMSRVQNGRIDIGADEYGTAVGVENFNVSTSNMTLIQDAEHNSLDVCFPSAFKKNTTLNIYSVSGKLIESDNLPQGATRLHINTSSYARGTYIVNCDERSRKFVK